MAAKVRAAKRKTAGKTLAKPDAVEARPGPPRTLVREAAVAAGSQIPISPLDVMLGAMRELWARAESLRGTPDAVEERLALIKQASGEAHKAAVYVHPRIASVEIEGEAPAVAAEGGREIGSRDLARRLLFAIAIAEQMPAARKAAEDFPVEESTKEKP